MTSFSLNTPAALPSLNVSVKKLLASAVLPTYSTDGSGAFDIRTTHAGIVGDRTGQSFKTGLAFEIPEGHVMLVFSRSGHGFNRGVRLANCVGVIDSDYRGELAIKLVQDNTDSQNPTMYVAAGDRIAQGIILPFPKVNFVEVPELNETQRGSNGFGSTGTA